MAFWLAVVSVALVSSIESLLSAKAVDHLDPFHRKSDLDKDLVAMGSGSALAALVGGLPMISAIVRSSANISNGAKTAWSNFFHGGFLLIYLMVGSAVIELIPVPALSAMLVYTGYKLASPTVFRQIYKIGFRELQAFVVTIFAVLATDLIVGIAIGIAYGFVILLFKGISPLSFFKLQTAEGSTNDNNVLYLSGALIFSNYLALKSRMDSMMKKSESILLDFSDVQYIDHTVMVHLHTFKEDQAMNGNNVEFLHLNKLASVSDHPLSSRYR
jgi:MFS superfamily sulfate permease-like transporter